MHIWKKRGGKGKRDRPGMAGDGQRMKEGECVLPRHIPRQVYRRFTPPVAWRRRERRKEAKPLIAPGLKSFLDKKVFCACKENYEERRNPIAGKFSRGQVEKYRG